MRQELSTTRTLAGPAVAALQSDPASFILLFQSLSPSGRAFAFACDRHGCVDMDGMSDRTRDNYLYARAMIGRELAFPSVHRQMVRESDRLV
jgi:hypothetical protein